MKTPGPDHPITIDPNPRRVVASVDGTVIADTQHAMTLHEADYPPVFYVPRADAHMELLKKTEHTTHCPYKGDASYYTIAIGSRKLDNVVWSYEHPYPPAVPIDKYLAFYADRVRVEER